MDSIKKIGVVGAGQMGGGIAQVCSISGFETILWDSSTDGLKNGYDKIIENLQRNIKKGKLTTEGYDATLKRLRLAERIEDFTECELVIEAIVEDAEIKIDLFKQLDALLPPTAIIASNTSSIPITRLAASTQRPEQCIGIHFMNPVPVMQLIEIIRGLQTSDDTYNRSSAFCRKLGKTTVVGIDSPGFLINRILAPMINEAIFLLQEGCSREDIDTAMKLGTNQPMGPLELADFVGLDTLLSILKILHEGLGEDKYRPCPMLTNYVQAGWLGRKSGKGFYSYPAA